MVEREVRLRQQLTDDQHEASLLTETKGEEGRVVRVGAQGGRRLGKVGACEVS